MINLANRDHDSIPNARIRLISVSERPL
jgi:hypothetical protein